MILLLCGCSSEDAESISYTDYYKHILIMSSDDEEHSVYHFSASDDIEKVAGAFGGATNNSYDFWVNREYEIRYYNDLLLRTLPYPTIYPDIGSGKIESLMNPENLRYLYTFYVPNQTDFFELRARIESNENCFAFFPYHSISYARPCIEVVYAAQAEDANEEHLAGYDFSFGQFSKDEYFRYWIDLLDDAENLHSISSCRLKKLSTGGAFARGMTIYLNRSLTDAEILEYSGIAESMYNIDAPARYYHSPFRYEEVYEYKIEIVFAQPQTYEMLEVFCQAHAIESYEYDRPSLEPDSIILFYRYINAPVFRSFSIKPDMTVVHSQYSEADFLPFKDEAPPSTVISNTLVSEEEYRQLVRALTNNDFTTLPDEIGFGNHELESYSYIGVEIGGQWFTSGGDTPDNKNERYKRIFDVFSSTFELITS